MQLSSSLKWTTDWVQARAPREMLGPVRYPLEWIVCRKLWQVDEA